MAGTMAVFQEAVDVNGDDGTTSGWADVGRSEGTSRSTGVGIVLTAPLRHAEKQTPHSVHNSWSTYALPSTR